jgi:DNA-binding transcriptional ArsR family regulator
MAVDQRTTTFQALADPTEPFPITLQAVSKHLKVLERAGLIARGRSAQLRASRPQGDALKQAADWLADCRGFWKGGSDRLEEVLR